MDDITTLYAIGQWKADLEAKESFRDNTVRELGKQLEISMARFCQELDAQCGCNHLRQQFGSGLGKKQGRPPKWKQ